MQSGDRRWAAIVRKRHIRARAFFMPTENEEHVSAYITTVFLRAKSSTTTYSTTIRIVAVFSTPFHVSNANTPTKLCSSSLQIKVSLKYFASVSISNALLFSHVYVHFNVPPQGVLPIVFTKLISCWFTSQLLYQQSTLVLFQYVTGTTLSRKTSAR